MPSNVDAMNRNRDLPNNGCTFAQFLFDCHESVASEKTFGFVDYCNRLSVTEIPSGFVNIKDSTDFTYANL